MIYTATGHRPPHLGGYSDEARAKLLRFARQEIERCMVESDSYVSAFNTGMALGFDCACAAACVQLGIPFRAYLACDHPEAVWPLAEQERFAKLIARAAEVKVIGSGSYSVNAMQRRNEAEVDDSDRVLALWNGTKGGTANTVTYAMKTKRIVTNAWPRWLEFER